MLIVVIHNDGTGTDEAANYNVEVRVNHDVIWWGRVEGHNRHAGWQALLRQLANVATVASETMGAYVWEQWEANCRECGEPVEPGEVVFHEQCLDPAIIAARAALAEADQGAQGPAAPHGEPGRP